MSCASSARVISPSPFMSANDLPRKPAKSISVKVQFSVDCWLADDDVKLAYDTRRPKRWAWAERLPEKQVSAVSSACDPRKYFSTSRTIESVAQPATFSPA